MSHIARRALLAGGIGVVALGLTERRNADAAELTLLEQKNLEVVKDFFRGWEQDGKIDIPALAAMMTEDCIVALGDGPPAIGRTAFQEKFQSFARPDAARNRLNIVETYIKGPLVVTLRKDLAITPNSTREIPLLGAYVLKGGKIREWHEWFHDLASA
jgi:limonene-1,2-epoxide hydrolase